jgi:hypothetical protein
MKKIILLFAALFCLYSTQMMAQSKVIKAKTEKGTSKKEEVKSDVKLKKDGTPDKRFKNTEPASKGPTKKDGTLDKRFKENKSK